MLVAIAGGHGKVALHLTRLLVARGDIVRSLIRNPAHEADLRQLGAKPVLCDIENATAEQVTEAIGEADAVVFAAGAGPGSGAERKWTVDYGAAVKLIAAARAQGVSRYVMVSSVGADPDRPGDDVFSVYLRAKGRADAELRTSGVPYAIVRPGPLTDDPPRGRVEAADSVGDGSISRADVAAVLAAVLHEAGADALLFEVVAGDVPIEEAIERLVATRR